MVTLWAFGVYFLLVLALVVAMLIVSYVLGQRHDEPATGSPYESGIVSTGSAHVRLSAKFYLVAMFFVIFDLEAVFIFAWAVAGRALGWTGYFEVLVFSGVLIAALVYLWRLGALDWGSIQRHTR
jgi:NADH-quinone oxidoreductase subunit A